MWCFLWGKICLLSFKSLVVESYTERGHGLTSSASFCFSDENGDFVVGY